MQLCIHLPDDLAARFRAAVPARQRSAFVADMLRQALPAEDDPLYRIALAVEADTALGREMDDWDGVAGDGLDAGGDAAR
jgi:plasmid stability protein